MAVIDENIDPIIYEVLRNKLLAITEEQRIALRAVSGSPVVTEATDYNNGLYLADGTVATMGRQVISQAGAMSLMIKNLLSSRAQNPGVKPGDMFLVNDPYRGAIHQNDVAVVGPVFYRGQLVAWAGAGAHEVDVGGMDFASWCPKAKEVYQEGLRVPAVKIVEDGEVRQDIWDLILGASRLPAMLGLDLKAMIAANHVAAERLVALFDRYTIEVVQRVMGKLLDESEERLRRRLRELPDGVYRARDYLEHDGHENCLYTIALQMIKKGDRLIFDFSGSSPQAPGFINCTEAGLISGIASGVFPILAYDILWNEGVLRPLEVVCPKGRICNAEFPAPVGAATVEAVWCVKNVAISACSRLVSCHPAYRQEAIAVSDGCMATLNFGGKNQYGEPFGHHMLDPLAGGFGAYLDQDGLDVGGSFSCPLPNIANVETNENFAPILYLRRSFTRDSGGPGKHQGGRSAGIALTVHGVPDLHALIMTHGVEVPNSAGLFGGYPGSCVVQSLLTSSNLLERFRAGILPTGVHDVEGERETLGPKPGSVLLRPGDVFEVTWQGGGGVGDPLGRNPAQVAMDVAEGKISAQVARQIYGVVLEQGSYRVLEEETVALRRAIVEERLGKKPDPGDQAGASAPVISALGEGLSLVRRDGKSEVACRCGVSLGGPDKNWKERAVARRISPQELGPLIRLHQDLEAVQHLCPGCGSLLSLEVKRLDETPLWEISLSF
ncbi:MAG: hydantoinase B/oxoprolinase family protein [Candidatus Tectomicrobia bacterium]|uniref:Hydantoinase B/oxoprolinase family protein n=1 Tax=Tectimicrobiota bacterium TaxID=2528274 RepID=A0A932M0V9_UNCTE|nr:hydantoinase B/oxoprolinase family protein [Candidatus Tectomicrobia bacterium]